MNSKENSFLSLILYCNILQRVFLSTNCTKLQNSDVHGSPRIIIIGAGTAGISASVHLYQNGFKNIVLLEGKERIGGRIFSLAHEGNNLELGAQWIQGACASNSFFNLAQRLGITSHRAPDSQFPREFYCRHSGLPISPEGKELLVSFSKSLSENMSGLFEEMEKNGKENVSEGETSIGSLFDALSKKVLLSLSEKSELLEEFKEGLSSVKRSLAIDIGNDLNFAQMRISENSVDLPGGDYAVPQGLNFVLQSLWNTLPLEDRNRILHLNTVVKTIDYSSEDSLLVTLDNGTSFSADYVIVTVSLGVLKKYHRNLFTPSLPQRKIDAIQRIGFGQVSKIFFEWRTPWWSKESNFLFLQDDDNVASGETEKNWTRGISIVDVVANQPRLLVLWLVGSFASKAASLPDERLVNDVKDFLIQMTGDISLEAPVKVLRHGWNEDPLILGAFSYPSLTMEEQDVEALEAPLENKKGAPVICFAGEATTSRFASYLHGARSSGLREAQRLINWANRK